MRLEIEDRQNRLISELESKVRQAEMENRLLIDQVNKLETEIVNLRRENNEYESNPITLRRII